MNKVKSVRVSIDEKYSDTLDFYTKKENHSLSKLFNVLIDECSKDKPFKFKILKKLEKLEL